jgi:hypothetical protein
LLQELEIVAGMTGYQAFSPVVCAGMSGIIEAPVEQEWLQALGFTSGVHFG